MSFWKHIYLYRKELLIILFFKLLVIGYFHFQYINFWPPSQQQGIAMLANDTGGYTVPLESLVAGNGYSSQCRMPAYAPFYVLAHALSGGKYNLQALVIFQYVFTFLSAVLMFLILTENAIPQKRSLITTLFYVSFPLIACWDHLILSDSMGNSLLIFAIYFTWKYRRNRNLTLLFTASFFLVWSGFFRQIHFLLLPFLFWLACPEWWKFLKVNVKPMIVFILPFALLVGSWSVYNKISKNSMLLTVAPYEQCFGYLPKPLLELRKLMIAMGGDIQPWVRGSAGEFFVSKEKNVCPFGPSQYTSIMREQQLDSLRVLYQNFYYLKDSAAGNEVIKKSNLYLTSYKQEHTTQYFLLNRLKLLKQFVFPNHIDNIPGPAIQHMNVLQKSVKAYAWLGMWTLNILAFLVVFLTYKYNKLWFVLSLGNVTLVIVLAIFFGWIELRYWLPVHSLTILLFILSTGKLNFSKSETNTL